jgi:hypothetical protein
MDLRKVIDRLLYTNTGQIFVSVILGLMFSLIFKRVCKENCVIYVSPDNKEIEGKIFKLEDTCYKYKMKQVECNENPIGFKEGFEKAENQLEEPSFLNKVFA